MIVRMKTTISIILGGWNPYFERIEVRMEKRFFTKLSKNRWIFIVIVTAIAQLVRIRLIQARAYTAACYVKLTWQHENINKNTPVIIVSRGKDSWRPPANLKTQRQIQIHPWGTSSGIQDTNAAAPFSTIENELEKKLRYTMTKNHHEGAGA